MLKVAGCVADSIVDGPGLRFTVFFQGCPHHCPGCHNPETWAFEGGQECSPEELVALAKRSPLCKGITLSGGEPFCQPEALLPRAKAVREMGKTVYAFSGYTLEQLLELSKERPAIGELLHLCDVLIDGPYIEKLRDLDLLYRGSSNQRIIDLHEYFAK